MIESAGFDAAVKVGVDAFCAAAESPSDQEVWRRLSSAGVEPWLAERLLVFLPMAYTRRLLPAVAFADSIGSPGGQMILRAEPLFTAALARAHRAGRDEIERIATRSSEFNAINNALHGGSQLADLKLTETRLAEDLEPVRPGDGGVPSPRAAFEDLLRRHGIVLDAEATIDAELFVHPAPAGAISAQVDFSVTHPALAGSRLVESFAGYGVTWREAIGQTLTKLRNCSLHPIIEGLLRPGSAADHVQREPYEHPDGMFDLVLGPQLVLFTDQPVPPARQQLDALLDALRGQRLSPQVHALRLFLSFRDGRLQTNEVLLEGETWPAGEAAVADARAPLPDGTVAIRIFALLVPTRDR